MFSVAGKLYTSPGNYRMQKRSVVNSHAIDGLIDLLLESVIDARKPLSKTAGSEPTHQCSVPQIVALKCCSLFDWRE